MLATHNTAAQAAKSSVLVEMTSDMLTRSVAALSFTRTSASREGSERPGEPWQTMNGGDPDRQRHATCVGIHPFNYLQGLSRTADQSASWRLVGYKAARYNRVCRPIGRDSSGHQ